MLDNERRLSVNLKAQGPQPGGDIIFIDSLIKKSAKLVVSRISAIHHGLVDHGKLRVRDRMEVEGRVDGHGGEKIGNRMKTAECFLNKFQGHSVVFILLPITQSFFPGLSMTNAGRESTALAFEP